MTNFNDREKAYEAKFAQDEQLRFKVEARRDKLLGLWLAEKMGKSSDEAAEYAKEVVISDLKEAGDEDVIAKVLADIETAGLSITREEIVNKLSEYMVIAAEQLEVGE
ncbi:MAG: hypothetical protein DHS20C08_01270 [Rhodomicrobium sp.]|nr:MAG: hypothetical protein DHS20C08_01270 [Rhodomicrobium sp.]